MSKRTAGGGVFGRLRAHALREGQGEAANGAPAASDSPGQTLAPVLGSWLPPELQESETAGLEGERPTEAPRGMVSASPEDDDPRARDWLPASPSPPDPESAAGQAASSPPEREHSTEPDEPAARWLAATGTVASEVAGAAPEAAGVLTTDERPRRAVEAYFRQLGPRGTASAVAHEVIGSFQGGEPQKLLRHTRTTAAKHAAVPLSRKGWRARADREAVCQATPTLLAARANGELDGAERERLERHLDGCMSCQAMELRARRADRAFAGVAGIALPVAEAVRAEAAAPTAVEEAGAPVEEAPMSERIPAAAAATPAVAAAAYSQEAPAEAPPTRHRLRRRPPVGVLAGVAGVAVAAIAAAVLLSSGSSKHPTVVRATTPVAPVTTPVKHSRPKHKPKPTAKPHHAAKKPVHRAAPATPAVASATPAPAAAPAPAPAASSSPPASSSPAPTSSPTPPSSSSQTSQPSVSIQQGSLGSTSAPQGIGH